MMAGTRSMQETKMGSRVDVSVGQEDVGIFFVPRINRTQVGSAYVEMRDIPKPHCMLVNINVFASYRNRGIGSVLLDAVIEEMRRREACLMLLGVDRANERALHLYEKKGFRKVPELRSGPGDYCYSLCGPFYLMQLDLANLK